MKFCSECAHPVVLAIPEGDNRPRYVCTQCGTIHYQNPKMVIGSIPVWEQDGELKVLLWETVLTTLLIASLPVLVAGLVGQLAWSVLIIPAAILLLALSLFVMKKA